MEALKGALAALRENEIELLTHIAHTLGELGDETAEDRQRLLDVAQDLREMFFMVVVIGEFNAGKSTLINALLGENLLATGITPTTEAIDLIRYSETPERKPTLRNGNIREWAHPNTGAAGVAIVDTPGTGSVFQKHETTAKAFLHRSDLVIFVISAKRAFAETERLYLELAKNYGKKIILVLNQIDLLEAGEVAEVRRFIESQVKELLDIDPLLFMVSAKDALEDDSTDAGIDAVRAHLRGVYQEAPPARQKLITQLELAERIVKKHTDTVKQKTHLVSADTTKVREVQQELTQQSLGLETQLKEAGAEIDRILESIRQRGMTFIDTHLSVRKVFRAPKREELQQEFQDVVIGRALRDIDEATGDYVNAVIDHSRMYWRGVIDRLNQLRDLMEQEVTGLDAGVYAEQRENLQNAIRLAEAELKSYSTGRVIQEIDTVFKANMNGFRLNSIAALGGGILAILGFAAPGPLIGVVGGVAAAPLALPAVIIGTPLALVGGYGTLRYMRRVSNDAKTEFNKRIDAVLDNYHRALDDLTRRERARLHEYGTHVLTPVFSRLDVLAQRYATQQQQLETYQSRVHVLRQKVEAAN